jgi:hypothetical protein
MATTSNEAMILPALEQVYVTLKEAAAGSLYGTDKLAFMIDQNLNEFVSFLSALIGKETSSKLSTIAIRLILQVAKVRSSPEDYIIATLLI